MDLDDGKTYFALVDGEEFVRPPPRFKVGDRVQAFMGDDVGWLDGTVMQLGSPQAAWMYAIDLDIKGRFDVAHAPSDSESVVRKLENDIYSVVRGVARAMKHLDISFCVYSLSLSLFLSPSLLSLSLSLSLFISLSPSLSYTLRWPD